MTATAPAAGDAEEEGTYLGSVCSNDTYCSPTPRPPSIHVSKKKCVVLFFCQGVPLRLYWKKSRGETPFELGVF